MAAIYQWFTGEEFVITSTQYPLEFEDGMQTVFTAPSRVRIVGFGIHEAIITDTAPATTDWKYVLVETYPEDGIQTAFTSPSRVEYSGDVIVEYSEEEAIITVTAPSHVTIENGLVTNSAEDAIRTVTTAPDRVTIV